MNTLTLAMQRIFKTAQKLSGLAYCSISQSLNKYSSSGTLVGGGYTTRKNVSDSARFLDCSEYNGVLETSSR